jgi:hypothetical protein
MLRLMPQVLYLRMVLTSPSKQGLSLRRLFNMLDRLLLPPQNKALLHCPMQRQSMRRRSAKQ